MCGAAVTWSSWGDRLKENIIRIYMDHVILIGRLIKTTEHSLYLKRYSSPSIFWSCIEVNTYVMIRAIDINLIVSLIQLEDFQ